MDVATIVTIVLALFQLLTGVILAGVGWAGARLFTRVDELSAALAGLALQVAQNHPTKAEMEAFRNQFRETLEDVIGPMRADLSEIKQRLEE